LRIDWAMTKAAQEETGFLPALGELFADDRSRLRAARTEDEKEWNPDG
jgi:hypothetical protein